MALITAGAIPNPLTDTVECRSGAGSAGGNAAEACTRADGPASPAARQMRLLCRSVLFRLGVAITTTRRSEPGTDEMPSLLGGLINLLENDTRSSTHVRNYTDALFIV